MRKDVSMLLKETYQKISQMMQAKIDRYDLTFGLLLIINFIEKNPDASQKDVAEYMKFTQGAMSIALKRLLKQGMVEQIPLESDKRHNRLILTQKGQSVIDDYKGYLPEFFEDMFNGFEEEELKSFHNSLLKVNNNLNII